MIASYEAQHGTWVWDSDSGLIFLFRADGSAVYQFDDPGYNHDVEQPPNTPWPVGDGCRTVGAGGIGKVAVALWFTHPAIAGCLIVDGETVSSGSVTVEAVNDWPVGSVTMPDGNVLAGPVMPLPPDPPPDDPPDDTPEGDGEETAQVPWGMVAATLNLVSRNNDRVGELAHEVTKLAGILGAYFVHLGTFGHDGESGGILLPQEADWSLYEMAKPYIRRFRCGVWQSHDDAATSASGRSGHYILAIRPDQGLIDYFANYVHPFRLPVALCPLTGTDSEIIDKLADLAARGVRWEE